MAFQNSVYNLVDRRTDCVLSRWILSAEIRIINCQTQLFVVKTFVATCLAHWSRVHTVRKHVHRNTHKLYAQLNVIFVEV